MQIKNPNQAFKPVTVTFDTEAEYQAFREILYTTNDNISFDGKEARVFDGLLDEFDIANYQA